MSCNEMSCCENLRWLLLQDRVAAIKRWRNSWESYVAQVMNDEESRQRNTDDEMFIDKVVSSSPHVLKLVRQVDLDDLKNIWNQFPAEQELGVDVKRICGELGRDLYEFDFTEVVQVAFVNPSSARVTGYRFYRFNLELWS